MLSGLSRTSGDSDKRLTKTLAKLKYFHTLIDRSPAVVYLSGKLLKAGL
jgi:hypothetical protein